MAPPAGMSSAGLGLLYNTALLLFVAALGYTGYLLWKATASQDNKDDFDAALRTIVYVTAPMIFLLGVIAMYYTSVNPSMEKTYLFVMTHVALLFSLMAVSMNTLVKRTA